MLPVYGLTGTVHTTGLLTQTSHEQLSYLYSYITEREAANQRGGWGGRMDHFFMLMLLKKTITRNASKTHLSTHYQAVFWNPFSSNPDRTVWIQIQKNN
jgi:hypothetical protein